MKKRNLKIKFIKKYNNDIFGILTEKIQKRRSKYFRLISLAKVFFFKYKFNPLLNIKKKKTTSFYCIFKKK